jgi:hypothetical protein
MHGNQEPARNGQALELLFSRLFHLSLHSAERIVCQIYLAAPRMSKEVLEYERPH